MPALDGVSIVALASFVVLMGSWLFMPTDAALEPATELAAERLAA